MAYIQTKRDYQNRYTLVRVAHSCSNLPSDIHIREIVNEPFMARWYASAEQAFSASRLYPVPYVALNKLARGFIVAAYDQNGASSFPLPFLRMLVARYTAERESTRDVMFWHMTHGNSECAMTRKQNIVYWDEQIRAIQFAIRLIA